MKKEPHELEKAEYGAIPRINYKGVYVTKQPNGLFTLWGYKDLTAEGVDEKIDDAYKWLHKSIKQ